MHNYCAKINELNGFSNIEKKIVNMFWELKNGPLREENETLTMNPFYFFIPWSKI
jgi:hypothetical protein